MGKLLIPRRTLLKAAPFVLAAPAILRSRPALAATTVWTSNLPLTTGPSTSQGNFSFRQVLTLSAGVGSLGDVLVTFYSTGLATTLDITTASIGVWAGTNADITGTFGSSTFKQLRFGGSASFTVSNANLVSDPATLAFASTDHLVVVMDCATGGSGQMWTSTSGNNSDDWFSSSGAVAAGGGYNIPAPSGSPQGLTHNSTNARCVSLVQTQASAAGGGSTSLMMSGVGQ